MRFSVSMKRFFDSWFRVNKFDFCSGATYLALGLVAGYIYRNIPIRVECDHWTNFILDPYKISYAHIALILVIVHSFNGFGKYVYVQSTPCMASVDRRDCGGGAASCRRSMASGSCLQRFSETVTHMMVAYSVPLFLLTLYYNYGYEYGVTRLHLVYPLIAVLPYLINGIRSREMTDACQVMSGMSAMLLCWRRTNVYALAAHLVQGAVYYFNSMRCLQYRMCNSDSTYIIAMVFCMYLMYLALLQSCVDTYAADERDSGYRRFDLYDDEDDSLCAFLFNGCY